MFPKSDIIENRSKASVYEPPKLLFEVWMIFGNKYFTYAFRRNTG